MDEDCYSYPMWNPSTLFEISDPRLSRCWIVAFSEDLKNKTVPFFGFPEWVSDCYFYDSLYESEEKELDIFNKYRKLMDLEFPDYTVSEKAQIADDHWLMCPICIDAWENSDKANGMVICPKCNKMLHNPRYIDELPHF
jgi:hypothetical protein